MKILILDIEATDLAADIGNVLSIGYKWLDQGKVRVLSILDYPGKKINDDSQLLEAFRPIIEGADLIVHHFGDLFDIPFLQTRLLVHGHKPYSVPSSVDTWRIAKKRLKFGSNRLERILEVLGCPYKKSPVKLSVWADARVGDKRAIKYVIDHNYKDVLVEEWVYKKIRPVWNLHPKIHYGDRKCSICGGTSNSNGLRLSGKHYYQRLRCKTCGHSEVGPRIN